MSGDEGNGAQYLWSKFSPVLDERTHKLSHGSPSIPREALVSSRSRSNITAVPSSRGCAKQLASESIPSRDWSVVMTRRMAILRRAGTLLIQSHANSPAKSVPVCARLRPVSTPFEHVHLQSSLGQNDGCCQSIRTGTDYACFTANRESPERHLHTTILPLA
jgi:hypothetical protein